jgi:hypothetical protein
MKYMRNPDVNGEIRVCLCERNGTVPDDTAPEEARGRTQ